MFYLRGSESSPCPQVQFAVIFLISLKREEYYFMLAFQFNQFYSEYLSSFKIKE